MIGVVAVQQIWHLDQSSFYELPPSNHTISRP